MHFGVHHLADVRYGRPDNLSSPYKENVVISIPLFFRRAIVVTLVLTLQACMAMGPKFSAGPKPSPDSSMIYVFRPANFTNSAITPDLYVDDIKVAALTNGGFVAISVKPGMHNVHLSLPGWKGEAAAITATDGGGRAYFRVLTSYGQNSPTVRTRTFVIEQVSGDRAHAELSETRQVAKINLNQ